MKPKFSKFFLVILLISLLLSSDAHSVLYRVRMGKVEVYDPVEGWVRTHLLFSAERLKVEENLFVAWDISEIFIYDISNSRRFRIPRTPFKVVSNNWLIGLSFIDKFTVYDSQIGELRAENLSKAINYLKVNSPLPEEVQTQLGDLPSAVPLIAYATDDKVVVYDFLHHKFVKYSSSMGISKLVVSRNLVGFLDSFRRAVVYDPFISSFRKTSSSLESGDFTECRSGTIVYSTKTKAYIYDVILHSWVEGSAPMGYRVSCDRRYVLLDNGVTGSIYKLGEGWLK